MTALTLLDGGIGHELTHRAGEAPGMAWPVMVMLDRPELLQALHSEYFAAGAQIATVNSYTLHRDRLRAAGIEDRLHDLHRAALGAANAARDAHGSGRVAGSVGPLVTSYRPDLHPPEDEAAPLYAEIAGLLAPGVDLLIGETIASLTHLRAVGRALAATGRPFWLSVTVDDHDGASLRSGEDTAKAARIAVDLGAAAVLANCSAPETMPAALDALAGSGLPIGAYANDFSTVTSDFLAGDTKPVPPRDSGPEPYARHALGWLDHGATILGGCCETRPAHISAIAGALRAAGHVLS